MIDPVSNKMLIVYAVLFFVFSPLTGFAQTKTENYTAMLAGDAESKRDALQAISRNNSEDSSRLAIDLLRDADPLVRATAIAALGGLPDAEVTSLVMPLLSDSDELVRREAALSLGRHGTSAQVRVLTEVLRREKKDSVRAGTIVAIGLIGSADGIEPLLDVLRKKPKKSRAFLRRAAAKSIGQIVENPASGLSTPANFLPPKYKGDETFMAFPRQVKEQVFEVLSRVIGNKKEYPDTKREAAYALGTLRLVRSRSILNGCKSSTDLFLAEICSEGLLKLESR